MVMTFIVSADFDECARLLDDKRLGKQRVEALQILNAILNPTKGWNHHPATKMWRPYPKALIVYINAMIREYISRGFNNTMLFIEENRLYVKPPWLNWKSLHISHKCSLLRKDYIFYKDKFFLEEEEKEYMEYGYVWPHELTITNDLHPAKEVCRPITPRLQWSQEEVLFFFKENRNPKTNKPLSASSNIAASIRRAAKCYNLL